MGLTRQERVLITGASSGIGLATAIAHGRRGARAALAARGRDGLDSAAALAGEAGAKTLVGPGPVDTPFWSHLAADSGTLPASFPGSYRSEDVAAEIVRCAASGSRGTTVGGVAKVIEAASVAAAPIAERVMRRAASYSLANGRPSRGISPFAEPTGEGRVRRDLPRARRSIAATIARSVR